MPPKSKKTATKQPTTVADIEAAIEELREQADAIKKADKVRKKLTLKEWEAKAQEEENAKTRLKAEREAAYLKNKAQVDKLVTRMGKHLKETEPQIAHLAILRLLERRFDYMPKAKKTGGNLS